MNFYEHIEIVIGKEEKDKFKGLYGEATVTTEEGDIFDVLDFIRPLGYMEVKVNVKCVEEKDETPEE